MRLDPARVRTIALREFLTTVRRKAFVLTIVLMPLYVVFAGTMGALPSMLARHSTVARVVGVVDPAQVLGASPGRTMAMDAEWQARFFATMEEATKAFDAGQVRSILRVEPDYLASGRTSQYRQAGGLITSRREGPPLSEFRRRRLLAARVDSALVLRVLDPVVDSVFVATPAGGFEREDTARRLLLLFVPLGFGFILAIGIFTAGGYLLQGLGEEKESRILESLLAMVTPDELLAGKLLGLGSASLILVLVWGSLGSISIALQAAKLSIGAGTYLIAAFYFLVGYFFFASFMLGVGSLISNYQEANQWAALISFSAMLPFFLLTTIVDQPQGLVATVLSIFPWTAPVTMMMRLPSGGVPAWQLALSMSLLLACTMLMVRLSARVFRTGLLLYGKTPNLPEILRWIRSS
ncbi:MAG: ABC transporter permease [Candidatus Eisenbacteria bacterium]